MAGVWTKRLCASFFVQTTIQSLYMHRILVAGGVTMKKMISVIYYYDETDKGRTAQAVHKRDQSDAACGIYMFFMACANRVSAKWHRVDGIPYAGVVCGLGAWNSGACGNRGILAA